MTQQKDHQDHPHAKHTPAQTKAEAEHAMNEGLAAIYGEERDDLSTLERGGSRVTRWLILAVVSLAGIAIVAYASFFIYLRFFSAPAEDPLTLAVEVPASLVSGTVTDITVRYKNASRVPLASLTIDLNLPSEFLSETLTPLPTEAEEFLWKIGSVPAETEGTIVLHGTWLAASPSMTTVQALATYRPGNFNADFDAVASASVTTLESNLALVMTGPDKVTSGETATYVMTLANNGELAFAGVEAKLLAPPGFVLASSDPVLAAGDPTVWEFAEILPHSTATVTVVGSFSADITDVQHMQGEIATTWQEDRVTQGSTGVFTDVIGNGLSLQLVVNGATDDVTIDPGDPLRLTIGYENTGEEALTGVSLLVDFRSAGKIPVTWSDASLDSGRLTADGIRFDAGAVGTLAPHDKKIRNLIFPVRDELVDGEAQSWSVVVHATVGGVTIVTQPLTISLNSDTTFTAVSRYYDAGGAPVGAGSLPPQVGEATTYEIVWTLQNALHTLEDVRLSATVPPGVTFGAGSAELGTVSYDEPSRTVSWVIASLPASTEAVAATMTLSVTPDDGDIGLFIKLLSGSAFRGTDTTTGSTIQLTADALTTECEGDSGVEGKGTVEELHFPSSRRRGQGWWETCTPNHLILLLRKEEISLLKR